MKIIFFKTLPNNNIYIAASPNAGFSKGFQNSIHHCLIIFFIFQLFLTCLAPCLTGPSRAGGLIKVDVEVKTLDSDVFLKEGQPRMVSGVWTEINLYTNTNILNASIELFYGTTLPSQINETNYYSWEFMNGFRGPLEYIYLSRCRATSNITYFVVSVAVESPPGLWTLRANVNKDYYVNQTLYLETLKPSVSFSFPDIVLRATPFSAGMAVSNLQNNSNITVINQGNVPLKVTATFSAFESSFTFGGVSAITPPSNRTYHWITFNYSSMKPGLYEVDILLNATVLALSNMSYINIIPSLSSSGKFRIRVGYDNLELIPLGNLTLQYPKITSLNFSETRDIAIYISGSESKLEWGYNNIGILSVRKGTEGIESGVILPETADKEWKIIFSIKAIKSDVTGVVNLVLKEIISAKTLQAQMQFNVGPSNISNQNPSSGSRGRTFITIFIIFSILTAAGAAGYFTFKKKKRDEDRKKNLDKNQQNTNKGSTGGRRKRQR